jgi:hypothetical protein
MAKKVDTTAPEQKEVTEVVKPEVAGTLPTQTEDTPKEGKQEPVEVVKSEVKPEAVKKADVAPTTLKKVKVHLTEELDCFVGQVHYTGRKDRDLEVPSDVAAILVNGKKAYRI